MPRLCERLAQSHKQSNSFPASTGQDSCRRAVRIVDIDHRRHQLGGNQIRPIAIGRSNWLFAGSLRAGKRVAAIMSLVHSTKLNGHDPYAYLKDVLERLPTQRASRVHELLPHLWLPAS